MPGEAWLVSVPSELFPVPAESPFLVPNDPAFFLLHLCCLSLSINAHTNLLTATCSLPSWSLERLQVPESTDQESEKPRLGRWENHVLALGPWKDSHNSSKLFAF